MSAMVHTDPETLPESALLEAELSDAETLVCEAGWNQVAADWRIFLELGTIYAVRNSDHRVVATAAILPYSGHFAWISMVLVAGDYRRRGLATRLLGRCVTDLASRGLVPVVDATPAGRKVYTGLGFQNCWSFQRYCTPFPRPERLAPQTPSDTVVRPIRDDDWPLLCRYDAQAFGADRGELLARLRRRVPGAEFAAWRDGRICGFVLGRDGRSATQLGPLTANDQPTAQVLLESAVAGADGPIYIDVADSKTELRRWLHDRGFAPQRPFMRMVHGSVTEFGDLARTMAVAGPELG
jgi:ribosomal protein S18 acetylase RimI-like enzyme